MISNSTHVTVRQEVRYHVAVIDNGITNHQLIASKFVQRFECGLSMPIYGSFEALNAASLNKSSSDRPSTKGKTIDSGH